MGYIYKITSPKNRVYIGQTINLQRRITAYKRNDCKGQKRLINSLITYGFDNHIFEVIENCNDELLNERERYYQDLYDVLSKKGLNCKLTATNEKRLIHSDEALKKISESSKGRKWSEERKVNQSIRMKGRVFSEETKQKISFKNKGRKHTEEYKKRMSEIKKGLIVTEETRIKISKKAKGRVKTEEHLQKISLAKTKLILDTQTGVFYYGVKEVSELFEISLSTLKKKMYGTLKNNTSFIFPF
jgi:group I intron endonuclease